MLAGGIEPPPQAFQARTLPLSYASKLATQAAAHATALASSAPLVGGMFCILLEAAPEDAAEELNETSPLVAGLCWDEDRTVSADDANNMSTYFVMFEQFMCSGPEVTTITATPSFSYSIATGLTGCLLMTTSVDRESETFSVVNNQKQLNVFRRFRHTAYVYGITWWFVLLRPTMNMTIGALMSAAAASCWSIVLTHAAAKRTGVISAVWFFFSLVIVFTKLFTVVVQTFFLLVFSAGISE